MPRKVKSRKKQKRKSIIKPYWTTTDNRAVRLYQGNVLDVPRLAGLAKENG